MQTTEWVDALQDATVLNGLFILLGVIVSALAGIVGLLIKGRQDRQKNNTQTAETLKEVKEVRDHVANDHSENLRVDLDEKFAAVLAKIDDHGKHVNKRFDGLESTVGQLRHDFEGERERIRAVEDGQKKAPTRR